MAPFPMTDDVWSSASGIPTDIKFLFKEEENGLTTVKEINAHRFILALVSDVFKKGFYGGMPDDGNIEIKDVSKEPFEAMIDYIYNKKDDLKIYDLDILCSLYYLGDKYNINKLVKETLEAIRGKVIGTENVLDVGLLADQYSVYEELAETLYDTAARGLSSIFNGEITKVGEFFTKLVTEVSASTSCKGLERIMARVGKPPVCDNCKSSPCMRDEFVTKENFVPGASVITYLAEDKDFPACVFGEFEGCGYGMEGKLVKPHPLLNYRFQFQNTDSTRVYQMDYSEDTVYYCDRPEDENV